MKRIIFFLSTLIAFGIATPTVAAKKHTKKSHISKVKTTKLNLNKIDAKTLAKSVKGIGPKRAEAIIAYRDEHGRFKSFDDLLKVKGIGRRFLDKQRQEIEKLLSLG